MDGIGTRLLRDFDDPRDIQMGFDWALAVTQMICLIRLVPVRRKLVLLSVDRDCGNAEFAGRAKDTNRYLAPAGD